MIFKRPDNCDLDTPHINVSVAGLYNAVMTASTGEERIDVNGRRHDPFAQGETTDSTIRFNRVAAEIHAGSTYALEVGVMPGGVLIIEGRHRLAALAALGVPTVTVYAGTRSRQYHDLNKVIRLVAEAMPSKQASPAPNDTSGTDDRP